MNREEKERYVIQLYKEGKTVRKIAELTHMSFRDIGAIIKKVKAEAGERGPLQEDDEIKIQNYPGYQIVFRTQIPCRSSSCIRSTS